LQRLQQGADLVEGEPPLNARAAAWALKHGEQHPPQRDELTVGL